MVVRNEQSAIQMEEYVRGPFTCAEDNSGLWLQDNKLGESIAMINAELSYNPYLMETKIKFNGQRPRINSLVEKYQEMNLQSWITDYVRSALIKLREAAVSISVDFDIDNQQNAITNREVQEKIDRINAMLERLKTAFHYLQEYPDSLSTKYTDELGRSCSIRSADGE